MRLIDADKLTPRCMFRGRCDSGGGSKCDRCTDYAVQYQDIEDAPTVSPERKMGRWLPDNTDYYRTKFICSACGESEEVPTMGFGYAPMWGYCPNCGAVMKEGEQE